ncbi:MAG: ABC transporter permease [Ignavibacteriales bacterium]|nr:ABC transporter permease [Ignavibacteriales bacterium]
MIRRLWPVIKKEFRQIRRDKRVLAILTLVPAFLLFLNGYALNFDVTHIRMAVVDLEKSGRSREFLEGFKTSGYFDVVYNLNSAEEASALLDDAAVLAALVIPPDFSRRLLSNQTVDIQVLVDGVNSNTATTVIGYVQAVTLQYSRDITLATLSKIGRRNYLPINYEARIWYNPELKSVKFLVPGLIGFILAITCVIATALSIVREKERNTIEQITVSPVHALEFILGKMVPYAVISLVAAVIVILAAYVLFGVEVKGSYLNLFVATLLFVIAALSIGLFISTIAESQQVAFQVAALASMLPTLILSGFIFPIRSMPLFLQILSNITPAKYYLVILRGIILKGVGFAAYWEQMLSLILYAVVLLGISSLRFRKTIG